MFFSERYGRTVSSDYKYNLTPFSEIKRYFKYYDVIGFEGFVVNIIGNIVAFIPFGLCLPIVHIKYRKFGLVIFDGFIFTVSIETVQLMSRVGSFDVDDIILNTTGVILGYTIYRIMHKTYFLMSSKRDDSNERKKRFKEKKETE